MQTKNQKHNENGIDSGTKLLWGVLQKKFVISNITLWSTSTVTIEIATWAGKFI